MRDGGEGKIIQRIFDDTQTNYVWPVIRQWQWGGEFSFLRGELERIQECCLRHNIKALQCKRSLKVFAPRGNKFASFEEFYFYLRNHCDYCVVSGQEITLIHDGYLSPFGERWSCYGIEAEESLETRLRRETSQSVREKTQRRPQHRPPLCASHQRDGRPDAAKDT